VWRRFAKCPLKSTQRSSSRANFGFTEAGDPAVIQALGCISASRTAPDASVAVRRARLVKTLRVWS
jgi:hypothetical protein